MSRPVRLHPPPPSLHGMLPRDVFLKRQKVAGYCRELHDEKIHEIILKQILFS